ncbi:MAG TPA: cadherin domain-containing protein, partial [Luteolibacter sp.]|nr:cadherin domain-containing protein [Luteolibacter sp.]
DDAQFAVAENSTLGTVVGAVTANDPDAGQTLAFAITEGNDGDAFAIDSLTGELTVTGALDFETQPQSVLTVTVTDDQDPPLSDTATITIDIEDVNEAPSAHDAQFAVAENSAPATVVGSVTASDPDAGQTLAFAITEGNDGDAFAIDSLTGELTVAGALDFETLSQYILTVTVTDDHDPALSDTATITIDIEDVNEAPSAQDAQFAVAETSTLGTVVGAVTANDPDAGQTLAFAITAGNQGDAFAIDPLSGEITVNGALDFETLSQYILTVTVTDDQDPALSDTATITIDIEDVNEAPVTVGQHVEVQEDGSVVIELLGSDPDGDSLDYTLKVFPSHGTLTGTMPSFTYTPAPGYHGPDSICYLLNDGQLDSEPAEITITVISNAPAGFDEWLAGFDLTGQPSEDADRGGLNNLAEFLFGYDPTNPSDDLLFRLELVPGDGTIEVIYPDLKPVGNYHLSMAADPALLSDPANRVETITKAQIEAMTEAERADKTFETAPNGSPVFFRLEFEPPPAD